jgi:hypothetical protein
LAALAWPGVESLGERDRPDHERPPEPVIGENVYYAD